MLNLIAILPLVIVVTASLACRAQAHPPPDASIQEGANKSVQISCKRVGDKTQVFVENRENCEITVTFEMRLVNLKSDVPMPYTAVFPARSFSKAFEVTPTVPGTKWEYAYTNFYKLGSYLVKHRDDFVYNLPYSPGKRFVVTQAHNGTYSHKGSNRYAVDWKMPEGTVVRAARGGLVVKVKEDSETGGPSMKFDRYNNFVLIRHDDGTLGHYCHLKKNGVLVKPGQRVTTGQAIARSGNTGFSSGPHLHFCVFRTLNGRERESIPIRFRTAEQLAATLMEDRRYSAVAVGKASTIETAASIVQPAKSVEQGGTTQ